MIERLWRTHLESLCYSGSQTVTIIATQSFIRVVFRMTKAHAKSTGHFRRARTTAQFMTDSTGRDLFVAGLGLRAVALITGDMRIESCRNGQGYAAATRPMTSQTAHTTHLCVSCMVEPHVEAAESRKRFQHS